MPALFIGHGSPMNAIAHNAFTDSLKSLGQTLPRPRAILVVSAHWQSDRTLFQGSTAPETIYDFYGFPKALFEVIYAAPGAPDVAAEAQSLVGPESDVTMEWGFDHGTWSVLRHVYPLADVPVFQMSLSTHLTFQGHLERARQIESLRDQGVLIVGSGNLVHNLRVLDWQNENAGFDWALEFDRWIEERLVARDVEALVGFRGLTEAQVRQAHPTLEHYAPILYVMGVMSEKDQIEFPHTGLQNGSISMRSVLLRPD